MIRLVWTELWCGNGGWTARAGQRPDEPTADTTRHPEPFRYDHRARPRRRGRRDWIRSATDTETGKAIHAGIHTT